MLLSHPGLYANHSIAPQVLRLIQRLVGCGDELLRGTVCFSEQNGDAAAECGIVLNANVTTQHDRVGHDDAIFDFAIMRDVGTSHQIAIVSDRRDAIFFLGSTIYGYRLAEHVAVTNDDLGGRTLVR